MFVKNSNTDSHNGVAGVPKRADFYHQIRGTLLHNDSIYFASELIKISIASILTKVGYSTQTIGDASKDSKFNILVAPFRHADGSETGMKIKEIQVNQAWDFDNFMAVGFQPGIDTIQIFSEEGKVTKVLSYACKDYIENNCYDYDHEAGWYDATAIGSWDFTTPLGDTAVNFGEGYVVKAGQGGGVVPTATFSGEVKQNVSEIPGKPFVFAGNSTPVDIKVGQIKVNQAWDFDNFMAIGFQPGVDTIQIFNAEGKLDKVLSYACKDYIENGCYDYDHEAGWYDATAIGSWDFTTPFDSVDVPAGSAFVLKTGDGAGTWPTITIPNPLEKKDAE